MAELHMLNNEYTRQWHLLHTGGNMA